MNYTLAVTSCQRFDLLKKTLDSFINKADVLPAATVIVEDSDAPMPEWLRQPRYGLLGKRGMWKPNGCRRGQIWSLDELYSEVETEYVFHLEDDWEFIKGGFIRPSLDILNRHEYISSVSVRGTDCNGHPLKESPDYPFLIQEPYWEKGWGGYTFNPGMRRMKDLKEFGGSFGRFVGYGHRGCWHELSISTHMLDRGFRTATLGTERHVRHIGEGRSRAIEALAPLPKILLAVPATRSYDYSTHTSGIKRVTDGRVEAVRATWWKDLATFSNVDGRFFYGRSTFQGLPDDVRLDVPDDYVHLPHKVKAICEYALAGGYDYLIKADDDTALYIDRLMRSGFDRVDQMGYYPCKHEQKCADYAVGMCYTLSRKAMELVAKTPVPVPGQTSVYWAEDYYVGRAMRDNGIKPVGHPGWVPNTKGGHYVPLPLPPKTVAAHSLTPENMLKWYADGRP